MQRTRTMQKPRAATPAQQLTGYVIGLLIAAAVVAVVWVPVRETVFWLANLPEVGNAFRDPVYGRQDAWISIGSFLLLSPFILLLVLWVLTFVYALPAGVLLPLGRRVGIPEWITSIFVVVGSVVVVASQSSLWLSPCLRSLGLLARACLTVMQ
jgi:hypothetical protein